LKQKREEARVAENSRKEYLEHLELSDSGFVRQLSGNTGREGEIGSELSLIYRKNWEPHWQWMVGYWRFESGRDQTGTEISSGDISRLNYNY
jgi:hypothetical protein